jgi:hypothetical protein
MSYFSQCPRCGGRALDRLETYSHCVECLYVEDYWGSPDKACLDAERILREFEQSPPDENLGGDSAEIIEFPVKPELAPIGA